MRLILRLACIPLLFFSACGWDDDTEFFPQTQAAFLLVQDLKTNSNKLALVQNQIITDNWQPEGIANLQVSDIAGNGNTLWISDAQAQRILKVNPESQAVIERVNLDDFRPHFLTEGDEVLLISDTIVKQIAFWNKKKGDFYRIQLDQKPGRSVYKSKKFYLQTDCCGISIWQEDAMATINNISLQRAVVDMTTDNSINIWVYTKAEELYQANVDFNSNTLLQAETAVNFSKKRFTPFLRQDLGKEWLFDISLQDSVLNQFDFTPVSDFEVDFLDGRLYYIQNDSLWQHDGEQTILLSSDYNVAFKETFFYRN